MSLPTTEIVIGPSSEAYRADPNVLTNGFGPVSKVDGLESIYFGLQLEDTKTSYIFNNWTTRAHHQRLIDSPSYRDVLAPMNPAFSGAPTISHVQFPSDVTIALKQPVTEIGIHTANTAEDRQKVLDLLAEVAKSENFLATCGALEENDKVTVFMAGWKSVQEHLDTIKSPHLQALLAKVRALGTNKVTYIKSTQYSL